jgi:transcriptional regulator with XRE-family HTH domain
MDQSSPGQTVDAVIARIRAFMRQQNLNRTKMAERAGLTESSIRHIEEPDWNPTADTLRTLLAVVPGDFVVSPKQDPPASQVQDGASAK